MLTISYRKFRAAAQAAEAPKGAVGEDPTHLHGKTMGEVVNELDRSDLKKSYKAIDEAYDIVIRKDGIDDTQKKLDGLKEQVGEKVYDILKLAMEHCEGKLLIVKPYFVALTKKAEEYFLSRYVKENKEETTVAKAIPLWSQYKSSMVKGLELNMSPSEPIQDTDAPRWPTAAKYRTEVQKREKETKGGNGQAGQERNSAQQTATVVNLVSKGWSPRLAGAMNVLCTALNRLGHEEQDKFAGELLALGEKVTKRADELQAAAMAPATGTIVKDETGQVVGTTSSEVVEQELDAGTKAALQAALDKEEPAQTSKGGSKRKGARAA